VNREDLHVGMRVWLSESWGRGGPRLGEVVKVGRLLVDIAPVYEDGERQGYPDQYRIDEQVKNEKESRRSFQTFEQREKAQYESEVAAYLKGVGVQFNPYTKPQIDFADRAKIMDLLVELGYEPKAEA